MVAIVAGARLGLELRSLPVGQQGVVGEAAEGRNGQRAYVNVANGNLVLQNQDDMLVGRGQDAPTLRTYNSRGGFDYDNGDRWTMGVERLFLTGSLNAAGSVVSLLAADGASSDYAFDSANRYVTREGAGAYDAVVFDSAAQQYEWRDGDTGATKRFNQDGVLLSSRDAAGFGVTYGYKPSGLLESFTTATGETTIYDYGASGANLLEVRTTAGGITSSRVSYAYDAKNRLASVTVDLSPDDRSLADGNVYRTTYAYDGDSTRVTSVSQADGSSVAFTYLDAGGGLFLLASVTDAPSQTTRFSYDLVNRATVVTDALGQNTRYDYDSGGQILKITGPAVNGMAATRQFTYTADGDCDSVTDGEGRRVQYQYVGGNQVLQRDAAGNTVTRTFNASNQVLAETRFVVPDPDGAGAAQASTPLTTRYVYKEPGQLLLRFEISPEGRVTEHRYNGFNQRVATIAYAGALASFAAGAVPSESDVASWAGAHSADANQRVDFAYDTRGQLQSRTSFAKLNAAGDGVADGSESVERFVYDRAGLLLQTISAGGGVTGFTFDGLGRMLTSTDAGGVTTVTRYADSAAKTVVTLANGRVSTSSYDVAGRLVSAVQSASAGAIPGETKYFYDALDRRCMTQDPAGIRSWILYDAAGRKAADIDGDGTVTGYQYDRSDRVVAQVVYAVAAPVGALINAAGQPIPNQTLATLGVVATPGRDMISWSAYDAAGRLVKTAQSVGSDGAAAVTEMRYDGADRLVLTTAYANLVVAAGPTTAPATPAASSQDRSTRQFYRDDGLLAATLDAEGYLTSWSYDGAGRQVQRVAYATATSAGLRASGALAELVPAASAGDQRELFFHDGKGQLIAQVDAESYLTETVYDAGGRVVRTVRYANRTAADVTPASSLPYMRPLAGPYDRVVSWQYDARDRLTQETSAEGVVTTYAYDSIGNLVSTVRAAGTGEARSLLARFDLLGHVTGQLTAEGAALLTGGQTQAQVDAIWSQYATTFTYDGAGRKTSTRDPAGSTTWFYYARDGALTYTVNALGAVTENRYDAQNRMVKQVAYANLAAIRGPGGFVQDTAALPPASAQDSVTVFTYGADGGRASETDAEGNATTTTYNAFGDVTGTSRAVAPGLVVAQTQVVDRRGLRTATVSAAGTINATVSTEFDAFGRAVRTVDANGNVRQQSFDRLGRIVLARDPLGGLRSSSYDAFGRQLTQTDATGAKTSYAYDPATRSVSVTTPEGIRTTTVMSRHGQVQSVTDGLGQTTSYLYDRDGRLVRTTTPVTSEGNVFDAAGRLVETTDANGNRTTYIFDAANRVLTRRVDPQGLNLTTSYQYDAKGQRVAVVDPNGVTTTYQYDRKGQVLRQTVDPAWLNLQTVYAYDAQGKVLTVTAAGGTVTQYVYDALGRRTTERVDPAGLNVQRSWTYDRNGNLASSTDAGGGVTRYAYDAADLLVFTLDPVGDVKQRVYDAEGRVVKTTVYAKPINVAGLGAVISAGDLQSRLAAQPLQDLVEHRVYDRDGRLRATVDGAGGVVLYTPDANGNVTSRMAYAIPLDLSKWVPGTLPVPTADAAHDERVSTIYDTLGRALYSLDGVGALVAQRYDGNGNLLERVAYAMPVPAGTVFTQTALAAAAAFVANGARDAAVRNTYDAADRRILTVDGTGAVKRLAYDANGNLVRETAYATALAPGSSPAAVPASAGDRVTSYAYDTANRRAFTIDALNAVTEEACDRDGNVVRQIAYAVPIATVPALAAPATIFAVRAAITGSAADRSSRFGYDAAGRQVLAIDAEGAATETIYAGGRVAATTTYAARVDAAMLPSTAALTALRALLVPAHGSDRTTRHVYDAAGRRMYDVDTMYQVSRTDYDGAGRVWHSTRYLKTIGPSILVTADAIAAAVGSDPAARTETYEYDAGGRRTIIRNPLGQGETYGYDALGREVSFTNRIGATWNYTYDAAGRRTSESAPGVDVSGTSLLAGVLSASYSEKVRVVTLFGYDALGNLTDRTEAAGRGPEQRLTRYEYDAAGRQVRVVFPPVDVYDVASDNVAVNGASGMAARKDKAPSTPLETRTYYDTLGNAVAGRDIGGALSQKVYDGMGRVLYEIDALGFITGRTYDAFGGAVALTRYGSRTGLAARPVAVAAQAVSRAEVEAVLAAASFVHAADRTLRTGYDKLGRIAEITQPQALVHDGAVSAAGQDAVASARERRSYDAFGDLVQVASARDVSGSSWYTTTHYFDAAGREKAVIDAMGYVTSKAYDAVGNLTSTTEYATALPQGWWNTADYAAPLEVNDDNRTVNYVYDLLERRIRETRRAVELSDAADGTSRRGDVVTTYGYDALGNQTSITDALNQATLTTYDSLGRVSAVQLPVASSGIAALTEYRRDAYGNVVVQTEYANGTSRTPSSDDRRTFTHYDVLGHATEVTDANGYTVYSSFDAYGRVAKSWRGVSGNDGVVRTAFQVNVYDALGQLVETRTPASTSQVRTGLNAAYLPATLASDNSILTPNWLTLAWSGLTETSGGTVRVEVDYTSTSTQLRDAYGTPVSGEPSRMLSSTQDFTAAQAVGGVQLSWATRTDAIACIRVRQLIDGAWTVRWEGSLANAGYSGLVTLGQAEAGLVYVDQEYNGFGEMTRKGTQGGRQEYFDYDAAGRLWRTNSGDGIDRVRLYDLQGNVTAEIQSSGSGGTDGDMTAFVDAAAAAATPGTRRVDIKYDGLGRVTERAEAARLETQGGVGVQRQFVTAVVQSALPVGDLQTASWWSGQNQIRLGWDSLAALGSGDMRVTVDYLTPLVTHGGDFVDSMTQPTWTSGGLARQRTSGLLDADANASGLVLTWTETSPTVDGGGVGAVTRIRVEKKEVSGNWVTVIDQAPGSGGNEIRIAAPADPQSVVRLQLAPAGSSSWVDAPGAAPVNFGNLVRYDVAPLGLGSYDYRLFVTAAGQAQGTPVASGRIALTQAAPNSIPVRLAYGQPGAGAGVLAWTHQAAGVQQGLNYRPWGSTGAWTALPITLRAAGTLDGVDTSQLAAGCYEFELVWGGTAPAAHAIGSFTVVAAAAGYDVAQVGLPNILGLQLGTMELPGTYVAYSESNSVYTPGAIVPSLSWNACRASAKYRLVGGNWVDLQVDSRLQDLDTFGLVTGEQRVSLAGLPPGVYEIEIRTTSGVIQFASARVVIAPPAAPAMTVTTPPWTPAWHVDAVPAQYTVQVTAASGTQNTSSPGVVVGVPEQVTSKLLRPTVVQNTDRWGNVVMVSDPRSVNWKTTYKYNANNQMVRQTLPLASGSAAPVTSVYYDALGRQVATRDARGNVNGQVFDAIGNLVEERHADGGVVRYRYDVFGQKKTTTDAESHEVRFSYDHMGRVLSIAKGSAWTYTYVGYSTVAASASAVDLTDSWSYDQLGRRLTSTNGNGETVRYAYDLRGNLVQTQQPMGQLTRAAFDAQGRKTWELDANGFTASWGYDYFGLLISHTDLGGARFRYVYDHARQLVWQTNALRQQSIVHVYDAAGQVTSIADYALGKQTDYAYDAAGRKVREKVVQAGATYQDNHLGYDAVGNLRDVADARVHITMDYDAAGNRTRIGSSVDYQGMGGETRADSVRYFIYDAMNRQTVVDALDANGTISASQGHLITYYWNGNRKTDTSIRPVILQGARLPVIVSHNAEGVAQYSAAADSFVKPADVGWSTEVYAYDALNRLQSTERDGVQIDFRRYDGADREIESGTTNLPAAYRALLNQGLQASQSDGNDIRMNRYDGNGRLIHQQVVKSDYTPKADISWDSMTAPMLGNEAYRPGGYDAAGNVLSYTVWDRQIGSLTKYTNSAPARYEGYQAAVTTVGSTTVTSTGSTTQGYDSSGFLVQVTDAVQPANTRAFVNDANGKALYVRQNWNVQRQLIVNGEVLGIYGVGVDTAQPAIGNNNPNFANVVDFDFGYAPIKSGYPGASPGAYRVQAGDTLQSIAQSAYGDSALWFRIADANGLATSKDVRVGQTLTIPNRVGTINNNNGTFKPYDPTRITGDLTPTLPLPTPAHHGGCGGMGQLLMVVVAVAVASVTGGIGGAALGSIASQAVGLATGTIENFSWKSVALATISGGVSKYLPAIEIEGLGDVGNSVVRAAQVNAVAQGIGVATGLQPSFDWRGVAAAGFGGGIGELVGESLGLNQPAMSVADRLVRSAATSFAAGVAVALARGRRVSVVQVATDAFGNALGQSLADAVGQLSQAAGTTFSEDVESRKAAKPGWLRNWRAQQAPQGTTWTDPAGDWKQQKLTELVRAGMHSEAADLDARDIRMTDAGLRDMQDGTDVNDSGLARSPRLPTSIQIPQVTQTAPGVPRPAGPAAGAPVLPEWLMDAAGWIGKSGLGIGLLTFMKDGPTTRWQAGGASFSYTEDDSTLRINEGDSGRRLAVPGIHNPSQYSDAQYLAYVSYKANGGQLNINDYVSFDPPEMGSVDRGSRQKPEWLRRLDAGNAFNKERLDANAYPYNEVYVNKPWGNGYFRVDSYNPDTREIVSRKFTQFSEITEGTGIGYINEMAAKYPDGAKIANVPTNIRNGLAGQVLTGDHVLEIPVQIRPISQSVLDAANRAAVLIRDIKGKTY